MYEESSISHAVFTLHFEKINLYNQIKSQDIGMGLSLNSFDSNDLNFPVNFKINFIDLAGSERLEKSGLKGEITKESVNIDSGLITLSKVIMVLSENNPNIYVPYRDSKLTRILKDALIGCSITLMIACVSPSDLSYEESINTLNYASFAKSIKVNLISLNYGNYNNLYWDTGRFEEIIQKLKIEKFELVKEIENNKNCDGKENENVMLKNLVKDLKKKLDDVFFNL